MKVLRIPGNFVPVLTTLGNVYSFYLKPGLKLLVFDAAKKILRPVEILKVDTELELCCGFLSLQGTPLQKDDIGNYHYYLSWVDSNLWEMLPNPDGNVKEIIRLVRKSPARDYSFIDLKDNDQPYYHVKNTFIPAYFFTPTTEQAQDLKDVLIRDLSRKSIKQDGIRSSLFSKDPLITNDLMLVFSGVLGRTFRLSPLSRWLNELVMLVRVNLSDRPCEYENCTLVVRKNIKSYPMKFKALTTYLVVDTDDEVYPIRHHYLIIPYQLDPVELTLKRKTRRRQSKIYDSNRISIE